jgi:alkaline phosphatase D
MAMADPSSAYCVHAEITGLAPSRPYWDYFMSGAAKSAIGRVMASPATQTAPAGLKFGFVSCANDEHGFFSAYRHLGEEDPDLVLFLGDYIYEYSDTRSPHLVRNHSEAVEADTLARYRNRHAQYRLDPDLQRLHANATAIMTWDDHEVQNDCANEASQDFADPAAFLMRRAAAYRAFYEHMPLRARGRTVR